MIALALNAVGNAAFRLILLPLIRTTTHFGGDTAWRLWERLLGWPGYMAGKAMRVRRPPGDDAISGMIQIVDLADGLINAKGEWVEASSTVAVKRITLCPHAERLKTIPDFCTRLGVSMGKAAFVAYAPDVKVSYAIPCTQSQGNPYCEYVLVLKSKDELEDVSST